MGLRKMPGALDGITVLDLTRDRPGALAGMFLCDNGARVIRIESPDDANDRTQPIYMVWDRGKESVELDISAEQEAFRKLVVNADVLIEDFEPSSPLQAIVDYGGLRRINPRLVHCSITAYGKRGPMRDEPGDEHLVMARMGILASQPGFRKGPVHVVHPVVNLGTAVLAAQGITASLYAREKTGYGRKVDTSVMAGAMMFAPKVIGERLEQRPFQLTTAGGGPFYSVFECADGNWIQIGCIHGGFVDIAATVMGIADLLANPRYGDGRRPESEEARAELFDIVANVLKTKPCAEWERIFEDADVPYARASSTDEAMTNSQVIANDMLFEMHDPIVGEVTQMGNPLKFTQTPGEIRGPRPMRGQHTERVLSEIADVQLPEPEEAEIRDDSPPLEGVRVMEMTNVIAGPAAGKCLGDLGADIIKFEPPYGDISRPAGMQYFLYLNSNKRSVSANTKTEAGQEIAQRIATEADIMLANMRPGATDRMGLSAEALESLNPGLIEAHTTAFGWSGPYAHRPGVDPLAQAWMGLQFAQGGRGNPPVFLAQLAPTDFSSGGMVALAAIMALYARERTGVGQKVDCNLLNAGAVLREDDFLRYEGKTSPPIADGGQYGLSALHRLFETEEGWLYLIAESQQEWENLCAAMERDDLLEDARFATASRRVENDEVLWGLLAESFEGETASDCVRRLREAGVRCADVTEQYNVGYFEDKHILATGMIVEHEHATYGKMHYCANCISFGETRAIDSRPTPLLGEHNREKLASLGYSPVEIDELYEKGVLTTEDPPAV
ncbi:MAG: CoA transferase [Chloroflexi bacterium]|nr:CoA transferase [Chloroflexota bacterium]